jgi:hypothetical protein
VNCHSAINSQVSPQSSEDWAKGNPARPGGSVTSKPTWPNTSGCSATSAFFVLGASVKLVTEG